MSKPTEVDRFTDKATDYEVVIVHNNLMGREYFCGYVALPEGHALFGKSYDDLTHIAVHGGLTFSQKVGELWVLGFDTAHIDDNPTEQNLDYVRDQCLRLAWQLHFPDALELVRQERKLIAPPAKKPSGA